MTMWAVTQTNRFKAGVAGAGLANWVSFHGGTILHNFDRILVDGDPYDAKGLYVQRSPIAHMGNVGRRCYCCTATRTGMSRPIRAAISTAPCAIAVSRPSSCSTPARPMARTIRATSAT